MVYDGHRGHRKGNEKPMPCLEDSIDLSREGHTLIPSDYTGWSMGIFGIFLAGSFSHTTEKINQQLCGNST